MPKSLTPVGLPESPETFNASSFSSHLAELQQMTDSCKNPGSCPVIIVEDDLLLRKILTIQLEAAAIKFCAASDGHQALALIRSHHPKVLVLDISLPGLSGFEIIEILKQDPSLSDLANMQLIVHTALDLSTEDRQRMSFGHAQFLTKTRVGKEFTEVVRRALSGPESTEN